MQSERSILQMFHIACENNNIEEVEKLLKIGVDVNGWSTFELAPYLYSGAYYMASYYHVSYQQSKKQPKATPLHVVVEKGHKDLIELLLSNGASIESSKSTPYTKVETPLCLAIKKGDLGIIDLFIPYISGKLDFSYSKVCDSNLMALIKILETSKLLQSVNLAGNEISDQGAIALADVIKYSTSLTQFNLNSNKLTSIGKIALERAKASNPLFIVNKNPTVVLNKIKALLYSEEESPNFLKLALITKSQLLSDDILSHIAYFLGEKEIATIAARGVQQLKLVQESIDEKSICGEGTGGLMRNDIELALRDLYIRYPTIINTKLLYSSELMGNDQYLLIIDPLPKESKFSTIFPLFTKDSCVFKVVYSGFQQDSNTYGDHSLITLSEIAGSLKSMHLKVGITTITGDRDVHAIAYVTTSSRDDYLIATEVVSKYIQAHKVLESEYNFLNPNQIGNSLLSKLNECADYFLRKLFLPNKYQEMQKLANKHLISIKVYNDENLKNAYKKIATVTHPDKTIGISEELREDMQKDFMKANDLLKQDTIASQEIYKPVIDKLYKTNLFIKVTDTSIRFNKAYIGE